MLLKWFVEGFQLTYLSIMSLISEILLIKWQKQALISQQIAKKKQSVAVIETATKYSSIDCRMYVNKYAGIFFSSYG